MNTGFITEFKLNSTYIRSIRFRYCVTALLLWLFVGLLDELSKGSWQENSRDVSPIINFWLTLATILILGAITIIILYRSIGNKLNGFRIMLNETTIIKTNDRNTTLLIEFSEIKYVLKTYRGSLFLCNLKGKTLRIPYSVSGFDKLEGIIKEKAPAFIAGPYTFYQKYFEIIAPVFIALFLTILALQNKIEILALGVFLICSILFAFERHNRKLRAKEIKLEKNFFLAPLIFISIILFAIVKKLLEK